MSEQEYTQRYNTMLDCKMIVGNKRWNERDFYLNNYRWITVGDRKYYFINAYV